MPFFQSQVPTLRRYIRDVEHDLCAVLIPSSDGDGYAHAVCNTDSGEILAWDGTYYGEPAPEGSLLDADWDDWDDMASKLLINTQSQWATDRMKFWLMPTFSPARAAGHLVHSWSEKNNNTNPAVSQGARAGLPAHRRPRRLRGNASRRHHWLIVVGRGPAAVDRPERAPQHPGGVEIRPTGGFGPPTGRNPSQGISARHAWQRRPCTTPKDQQGRRSEFAPHARPHSGGSQS